MVESTSRRRNALAIVVAFAIVVTGVVGVPGAHGQAPKPSEIPPESVLADEPLLVRHETRWSGNSLDAGQPWTAVDVEPGESVDDAYERLIRTLGVDDVAFNYQYEAHGLPNDPLFDDSGTSRLSTPPARGNPVTAAASSLPSSTRAWAPAARI